MGCSHRLLAANTTVSSSPASKAMNQCRGDSGTNRKALASHGTVVMAASAASVPPATHRLTGVRPAHRLRQRVWLLRLGVRVLHGRPYHPQTQGKEERFHRTLDDELLSRHTWRDLAHCAEQFARYRHTYNCERPHYSLGGDTPARHYRPSPRAMPAVLPALEYDSRCLVRRVRSKGVL